MSPFYGCTVSRYCTFTTTNVTLWLQHEDLSHAPSFDFWYCLCKLGFYNIEDFEAHFKTRHPDTEFKPKDYLLGPSLGQRFYCGFCTKVVTSDNPRWQGWRFSRECHLRAHFEGWDPAVEGTEMERERRREEWVFIEIIPH